MIHDTTLHLIADLEASAGESPAMKRLRASAVEFASVPAAELARRTGHPTATEPCKVIPLFGGDGS